MNASAWSDSCSPTSPSPRPTTSVGVVLRGGQGHQLTLPRPLNCWELRQTAPAVVAVLDELLEEHTLTPRPPSSSTSET
ncbi:hypothetical protein OG920_05605 [Streptomyces europaeiscabiei]|uniref:hypothetical protein n=1 Tax=Streptomyces europaeiscabiei TaxID=146819 RepID=UPI0029AA785E|nr:hypothetical protein [Streptomyces europaeiscabiei]MDX3630404.1 hypothetical protein [Streptomyces europaeiscabiei]MDX3648541.1 hypothetical protein [Streptomyces europaeiscabiei]